jgi:ComF family protein
MRMPGPIQYLSGQVAGLSRRLLDGLLPPCCILCGAEAGRDGLCPPCRAELPRQGEACARCALPGRLDGGWCGACIRTPPHFEHALAALVYVYPVDYIVHRFKFQRQFAAGETLAAELARAASAAQQPLPDVLVPVPLHFLRRAQRGFNQSELLARRVGTALDLPVATGLLRRARHTPAQSGLDVAARRRNLRGAFACRTAAGLQVALVDDVLTTGTTLNECALTLKAAGAAQVSVWVAARVPAPGSR